MLFSIMTGILSMNDVSKVGRRGFRSVLYFMFTTIIDVTLGLVLSTLAKGFMPLFAIDATQQEQSVEVLKVTLMDQVVNMFSGNIILPMSSMTMI